MRSRHLFLILIPALILVFLSNGLHAQYNDAGLWLGISVEKKLTSSTSLLFNEECRFNENMSQAETIFSDLGLSHKLNKYFAVSLNYRFVEKRNLDASYSTRHRLYGDVSGKYKIKKFTFSLRERIQSQVRDYYSSETGRFPIWYLRSKLSIKYNLSRKITPVASVELFYQLNNPEGNELDNIRYSIGFEYAFNKRHAIEPYYLIQQEVHVNNPVTDFIAGLSYSITF